MCAQVENSGIDQGAFIKRHALPKAGGGTVNWTDFKIGGDLQVYGRVFRITAADPFTRVRPSTPRPPLIPWLMSMCRRRCGWCWRGIRVVLWCWCGNTSCRRVLAAAHPNPSPAVVWLVQSFCEDNGAPLDANIEVPSDSYATLRQSVKARDTGSDPSGYYGKKANPMKRFMEASLGNPSAVQIRGIRDGKKRFLDQDRVVLRFYGVWDDTTAVYGSKLRFTINYYLADDTVEVLEIHEPNDGRQRFGPLLKRQPLPKRFVITDDRSRGIEDDNGYDDYYTYEDFEIGKTLNVLGRAITLYDSDKCVLLRERPGCDVGCD